MGDSNPVSLQPKGGPSDKTAAIFFPHRNEAPRNLSAPTEILVGPRGRTYRETVSAADAGRTLLDHLARRYRHTDRTSWEARLDEGLVTLDGCVASASQRLAAGSVVAWHRPPWDEPRVPRDFAVVWCGPGAWVVAKPSGLPTLPGGPFDEHTLLHLLRQRLHPDATPLHRLGRGTSGLVLVGATRDARRRWTEAFRARTIRKTYRALVEGHPSASDWAIDQPIGPVDHPKLGHVHAASDTGRAAHSDVRVLERLGDASLVDVSITTGRPHQIRIHLAACGHPLVGDPLYAVGGRARPEAVPGDLGYLLHAERLSTHDGRLHAWCAPPPSLRTSAESRPE